MKHDNGWAAENKPQSVYHGETASSTAEVKRKVAEMNRQREIKTAIDLTLSPAAKAEMRLRDIQNHRNYMKEEYESARVRLNAARRNLEAAENALRTERDKWRDIADTVHDQHK